MIAYFIGGLIAWALLVWAILRLDWNDEPSAMQSFEREGFNVVKDKSKWIIWQRNWKKEKGD